MSFGLSRADPLRPGPLASRTKPSFCLQTAAGESLSLYWQGWLRAFLRSYGDNLQWRATVRMHSAKQTPEAQIPAAGMLSVNANAKERVVSQGLRCEFWQKHSAFSILPFYSSFLSHELPTTLPIYWLWWLARYLLLTFQEEETLSQCILKTGSEALSGPHTPSKSLQG